MVKRPKIGSQGNLWVFDRPPDLSHLPDVVRSVSDWKAAAPNPLIIIGPNGSGKTVLLTQLAESAKRSDPEKKIVFVSGLSRHQVPNNWKIAQKYASFLSGSVDLRDHNVQSADLVLLDGIFDSPNHELFSDDPRRELVHEVNRLVERDVRVVMSLTQRDDVVNSSHFMSGLNSRNATLFGMSVSYLSSTPNLETLSKINSLDTKDLPLQSSIAPQFDYSGDGPISVSREPAPSVTTEKLELYEELILKVANLLDACPKEKNRTARLRDAVVSLSEFLPKDISEMQPRRLWARANTLRRHRDADLRARRSKDPDGPVLPEMVSELLSDLVEQFNVFALHDDVLRRQDAASLGPRDRAEVLVEIEAGRVLSNALAETSGLITESAKDVLREAEHQGSEASTQEGINADQAIVQALDTQRNGAIALVAKAISEVKKRIKSIEDGAWKHVGAEGMKFIFAGFVKIYEGPISTLLGHLHGGDVVNYVLRFLRYLTGP